MKLQNNNKKKAAAQQAKVEPIEEEQQEQVQQPEVPQYEPSWEQAPPTNVLDDWRPAEQPQKAADTSFQEYDQFYAADTFDQSTQQQQGMQYQNW